MDTIFQLSSLLTMPFWFLMIFLPHWGWTKRIVGSLLVVVPAALLYAVLLLPSLGSVSADLANPTLAGISALLATPEGATIGWVHFLAFDLFVGRWAYLDSRSRDLTAWIVSPTLFFVLMAGPLGLLLYLLARQFLPLTTKTAGSPWRS
jgi:hypothetical protein